MMVSPVVCAVTINYKNAQDTATCVASLLKSSIPVSVFVVDNSPYDPNLAQALAPFPDVNIICADENLGFGNGNNLGVQQALRNPDYAYVFLLNNDATVATDAIEQLLASASIHHGAAVFAPRIVLTENPGALWYGGGEVDWRRAGARVPGWLGPADGSPASRSREITFASGCAMLVRRTAWQQLGGFNPRFFMYEEDLELCLRVGEAGWGIWYDASALVQHQGQGSHRKEGGFKSILSADNPNLPFFAYHVIRNKILNVRLHARGRDRLIAAAGLSFLVLSKAIRFALRRRFDALASMARGVKAGFQA